MNENKKKYTESGPKITILQSLMKINGYFKSIVTGVYGPDTEYFLKKLKKDYNIQTDNIDLIIEKLESINNEKNKKNILNNPTIRLGDKGDYVKEVQTILKSMTYYDKEIDAVFSSDLDVSVKAFQFVNKLTPDGVIGPLTWSALISLYKPLALCTGENNEETHTVISGDTLYSISKKYNITVDNLKKLNNLTSDTLTIGQILKISETTQNNEETHTVISGDTLYSISKKYNTTVDNLKKLNNLTSDTLTIGQILKISETKEDTDTTTYTVVKGDTLYSIAQKFSLTVAELLSSNNLTSSTLSIGQILKISNSNITYTVISGDTLYSIAKKFSLTVDNLKKLNNLTTDTLTIGQILKIS